MVGIEPTRWSLEHSLAVQAHGPKGLADATRHVTDGVTAERSVGSTLRGSPYATQESNLMYVFIRHGLKPSRTWRVRPVGFEPTLPWVKARYAPVTLRTLLLAEVPRVQDAVLVIAIEPAQAWGTTKHLESRPVHGPFARPTIVFNAHAPGQGFEPR